MHTRTQGEQPIYRNYSKLLISESPLQVLPTLAVKIGLNEALMLQQVHYWISNPLNKNIREGRVWVYKTYAEWQKEFPFWSLPTIKRTSLKLEKIGILIASATFNRLTTDRTKWYAINYEKLDSLDIGTSDQSDPMDGSKRSNGGIKLIHSTPESTTEITTKNNNKTVRAVRRMPKTYVEPKMFRAKPEPKIQPKARPAPEPQLEPDGSVVVELMKMVEGWAISRIMIEYWLKKYGVEYLKQKIELTKSAHARKPEAYLNKALTLNWLPPTQKEELEIDNKHIEPVYPTHEENAAWYSSLSQEEKLHCFEYALTKHPHFGKILNSNSINFTSGQFLETAWFKMMMSLVGRAK